MFDINIFVVYNHYMKEEKYYIDIVLKKERERNERMQSEYKQRVSLLPKGVLVVRKINDKEYCYLRYREGKKVIQKYYGCIGCIDELRLMIEERKHLINLIKMLENEHKKIVKMEEVK